MIVRHGVRPEVPPYLEGFAKLALAAGQPERAARLLGAAEALRDQLSVPIPFIEQADHNQAVTQARERLGEAVFTAIWAEGQAMTLEQSIAYASAADTG